MGDPHRMGESRDVTSTCPHCGRVATQENHIGGYPRDTTDAIALVICSRCASLSLAGDPHRKLTVEEWHDLRRSPQWPAIRFVLKAARDVAAELGPGPGKDGH